MIVVFSTIVVIAGFIAGVTDANRNTDAVPPDRCRTFEVRFLPENKAFCEKWEAENWGTPSKPPR